LLTAFWRHSQASFPEVSMTLSRRSAILLAGGVLGGTVLGKAAKALDYPDRPIRFVVPYTAGGGADIAARLLGAEASASLGQQLVIENRGGASGVLGAEIVAKSPPDGYTIMLGTANWTISPSLFQHLPYSVSADFAPIALLAKTPSIVAVNPSLPVRSLVELIALAKASPGKINYASDLAGPQFLGMELLKSMAAIELTNIPYTGTGPAAVATIGNQVSIVIAPANLLLPFIKNGQLRGIAVTTSERIEALPELPTVAEAGLNGYNVSQWYGVLAPSGTPHDIVNVLNAALVRAVQSPSAQAKMAEQIMLPVGDTPDDFAAFIKSDTDQWAKAVKLSGLPPN
jgi:tripartite-type tricarboxylate transporter receptor subunit TctC